MYELVDHHDHEVQRASELRALLSDAMASNIEGNHQLTAKKGGKRNRIKSKDVGGVESHDTSCEEENLTSLEEEKSKLLLYCLYRCTKKKIYTHQFFSL